MGYLDILNKVGKEYGFTPEVLEELVIDRQVEFFHNAMELFAKEYLKLLADSNPKAFEADVKEVAVDLMEIPED